MYNIEEVWGSKSTLDFETNFSKRSATMCREEMIDVRAEAVKNTSAAA